MRVPPPVLGLAAAVAQRALSKQAAAPSAARAAGAAGIAAASLGLMGSALLAFRTSGTTVDPIHPDRVSALVTSGANALTRNPMYVGMAGVLLGHAVLRGSWRGLVPVAAFAAVMDRVQIPPEERALAARFGKDYEAYRRRVPRWLGPV